MQIMASILEQKMTLKFRETLNKGIIKTLEDMKRRRPPRWKKNTKLRRKI